MSASPGNFSPASVGADVNTSYLSKTHRINCFPLLLKTFAQKLLILKKLIGRSFENTSMKQV
jgi:hypothetical protein